MQLSRFFTLAEMTRSDTATRHGIANLPDDVARGHLEALCTQVLDPLRDAVQASITVNSGYRGPELNAVIRGAKKSQHLEGKAADIQSARVSVLDLFKTVVRLGLPYDQVIFEVKNRHTKWVHVSHDPSRARGAILVAEFGADGVTVRYRPVSVQEALDLVDPMPLATRSGVTPEMAYEELPDEPDFEDEPAGDEAATPRAAEPAAAPRRPAPKRRTGAMRKVARKRKVTPKRKAATRRSAPKRKAAPKRRTTGRRPAAAKRVRKKAKKHK
jgi:hypothetical protein